jgi:hypothetical protein
MGAGTESMNMGTTDSGSMDDWLEQALREGGIEHRAAHVADAGFTQRVLTRLPQPVALPAWRRPAIALLWLFAATAVLLGVPGLFDDAVRGTMALLVGHRISAADIVALLAVMALATWATLLYAMKVE